MMSKKPKAAKPIVVKLKTPVKRAEGNPLEDSWLDLERGIATVFGVIESAGKETAVGREGELLQAFASGTVTTSSGTVAAAPAFVSVNEAFVHSRVGKLLSFGNLHRNASDYARAAPAKALGNLRGVFQQWIPKVTVAWLSPFADATSSRTNLSDDDDEVQVANCSSQFHAVCLRRLALAWDFLTAAMQIIASAAAWLENTYVHANAPEGSLLKIGTQLFAAHVSEHFQPVFDAASRGFVESVARDREGNAGVERSTLAAFRRLTVSVDVYRDIEQALTEDAASYYTKLGNSLLYVENVSAAEYIRRVEQEIVAEDRRLRAYAQPSTRPEVERALQERLVKAHMGQLAARHLQVLVQQRDLTTVARLYRLARLPAVRQEDAIRKVFREYVQKTVGELLAQPELDEGVIELLVQLDQSTTTLVRRCFPTRGTVLGADPFSMSKKEAFHAALKPKQNLAAELLARFVDRILREGATIAQALLAAVDAVSSTDAGHTGDSTAASGEIAAVGESTGATAAETIDRALILTMRLFPYVPAKDVFEAFYARYFGKRLILQRTVGVEHERVVIDQLRLACGPSVAMKMNGMLKDLEQSNEIQQLMDQTRYVRVQTTTTDEGANGRERTEGGTPSNDMGSSSMQRAQSSAMLGGGASGSTVLEPQLSEIGPAQTSLDHYDVQGELLPKPTAAPAPTTLERTAAPFDFKVLVLTEGYWPTYTALYPQVPDSVARQMEFFKLFYLSRYSGRKLNWQHALSHCVVKAAFPKQKKEIVVSFLQALLLMAFNGTDSLTYGELLERVGLEPCEEVTCAIIGLYAANAKMLVREKAEGLPPLPAPKAGEPRTVVRKEDVIRYNRAFTHRLVKIRVNQVQLRETKEEIQDTTEKVIAERGFIIDAAVVRFMKARKTASHTELVGEVLSMLRFAAQPADIKKRVEVLIEREYLEREEHDTSRYRYLA